jgi:hypothetical protein
MTHLPGRFEPDRVACQSQDEREAAAKPDAEAPARSPKAKPDLAAAVREPSPAKP